MRRHGAQEPHYIGVYIGIMEKKMETTIVYWGYIKVILGLYWGYIGIMEKKTEPTIMGCMGYRVWV